MWTSYYLVVLEVKVKCPAGADFDPQQSRGAPTEITKKIAWLAGHRAYANVG